MTKNISVKITGIQEIAKKFEKMDGLVYLVHSMKAAASHVKGKTQAYPPSTEANIPFQRRWYERGYGSKWMLRDGSVAGSKTSKMLNRSWTIKEEKKGLTQIIGTAVSYAPYVHDKDKQAPFHANHGWKTVQTVAKEETPTILDFLKKRLQEWINSKV
jgi:hypothetical protein